MLIARGSVEEVREAEFTLVSSLNSSLREPIDRERELLGYVKFAGEYERLLAGFALTRDVVRRFRAFAPASVIRGPEGRPLPHPGAKFRIMAFTDCVGDTDPETAARIALQEGDAYERLVAPGGALRWEPTEPLSPAHLRGTVTSTYFAHCHKTRCDPSYVDQLIILGNSAPRKPNNPDAKGCPFVVAVLEGDAFYVGTLNDGGVELQELKPYIKELWHTVLGVEEEGTVGGAKPVSVFRSQFLLPLFEQLVLGNERVLDRRLCPDQEIADYSGVETDGIDTFGNFKTNTSFDVLCRTEGLALDDHIDVVIGGIHHQGRVARSHGDGVPGEVLLVRGSSPADPEDPNITRADIVVNGGRASDLFVTHQGVLTIPWAGREVNVKRR